MVNPIHTFDCDYSRKAMYCGRLSDCRPSFDVAVVGYLLGRKLLDVLLGIVMTSLIHGSVDRFSFQYSFQGYLLYTGGYIERQGVFGGICFLRSFLLSSNFFSASFAGSGTKLSPSSRIVST